MKLALLLIVVLFHLDVIKQSIPAEVRKVVSFLYVQEGPERFVPVGTGFWIGAKIASNADGQPRYAVYLVTAKHVLRNAAGNLPKVYVRLNLKGGGSESVGTDLVWNGPRQNVFEHPDPSVDLVVIPGLPSQTRYDFVFLPEEIFLDESATGDLHIREGTSVFFQGLFIPLAFGERVEPLSRFGRMAASGPTKVKWDGVETSVYLMEAHSSAGNSGAPVFFFIGAERGNGSLVIGEPLLRLAGVMKGFFGEGTVAVGAAPALNLNSGIAAVTPVFRLKDLLDMEILRRHRAGIK